MQNRTNSLCTISTSVINEGAFDFPFEVWKLNTKNLFVFCLNKSMFVCMCVRRLIEYIYIYTHLPWFREQQGGYGVWGVWVCNQQLVVGWPFLCIQHQGWPCLALAESLQTSHCSLPSKRTPLPIPFGPLQMSCLYHAPHLARFLAQLLVPIHYPKNISLIHKTNIYSCPRGGGCWFYDFINLDLQYC